METKEPKIVVPEAPKAPEVAKAPEAPKAPAPKPVVAKPTTVEDKLDALMKFLGVRVKMDAGQIIIVR